MDNAVRDYIDSHADEFFAALMQWLRIPSISADPARSADVRRSAEWLAGHLRTTGFETAEIWETGTPDEPGLPAVFAQWSATDSTAPTVLIYGHHDVQPVEPLGEWDSPPFEPVEIDGQILARGASDDKGQVLFHALGTSAWLAAHGAGAPPVTLKLIVEGEEESGSKHFADLLRRERERLACDVIVVSDTTMWAADVPSMCTGMRGVIDAEIDVYGPERDLHSGSFGGAVPNPLHALADLLAALHDAEGRVTLPGFYDKVAELTQAERHLFGGCRSTRRRGWPPRQQRRGVRRGRLQHHRADLGQADRRDQRHVGRPHRPWRQDDRAARSARQALVPAGRQPGARRGRRHAS